jgi:hypothetical protein
MRLSRAGAHGQLHVDAMHTGAHPLSVRLRSRAPNLAKNAADL